MAHNKYFWMLWNAFELVVSIGSVDARELEILYDTIYILFSVDYVYPMFRIPFI